MYRSLETKSRRLDILRNSLSYVSAYSANRFLLALYHSFAPIWNRRERTMIIGPSKIENWFHIIFSPPSKWKNENIHSFSLDQTKNESSLDTARN